MEGWEAVKLGGTVAGVDWKTAGNKETGEEQV